MITSFNRGLWELHLHTFLDKYLEIFLKAVDRNIPSTYHLVSSNWSQGNMVVHKDTVEKI